MPFLIGIEIQLRRDAKYIRISLAWQLSIYIYLVQMDLFFFVIGTPHRKVLSTHFRPSGFYIARPVCLSTASLCSFNPIDLHTTVARQPLCCARAHEGRDPMGGVVAGWGRLAFGFHGPLW